MKLPPRTTFMGEQLGLRVEIQSGRRRLSRWLALPPVQMLATIVVAVTQVGVTRALEALVPDMCSPGQHALLTCPISSVVAEASIIWGVIGPRRLFGAESTYQPLLYFLIVGAVLPIPFYFAAKRWPHRWYKLVNIPVLLNGANYIPPASGINYSSWFMVGFVFREWGRPILSQWISPAGVVAQGSLGITDTVLLLFLLGRTTQNTGSGGIVSDGGQSSTSSPQPDSRVGPSSPLSSSSLHSSYRRTERSSREYRTCVHEMGLGTWR